LGNKVLHQRLRGPSVAAYYPPRVGTVQDLRKLYPEYDVPDDAEDDWLEHLQMFVFPYTLALWLGICGMIEHFSYPDRNLRDEIEEWF
jgi:hypothetical protein